MQPVPTGLRPEEVSEASVLTDDECWTTLASATIGRLAVRTGDAVDIFPVNFAVNGRMIYLRSAPGSKLVDIVRFPQVAFEVDGSGRHTRWSVVVKGEAQRMSSAEEIENSGVLELATMTSAEKWNYVRITPSSTTGRRFVSFGSPSIPTVDRPAEASPPDH